MKHAQHTNLWSGGLTKRESTDEIKGKNVRLILVLAQRLGPFPPGSRPDRGRPTDLWLVGPDALRYKYRSRGLQAHNTKFVVRRQTLLITLGRWSTVCSGVGKHHRAVTLLLLLRRRRSVTVEARRTMGSASPSHQRHRHGRLRICSYRQRRSKP